MVDLLDNWRNILNGDKYARLNATIYVPDSFYADQIVALRSSSIWTILVSFIVMAIICLLFIPDTFCVLCSCLSIVSISIGWLEYSICYYVKIQAIAMILYSPSVYAGVFGYLSYWSVNLDPFTVAALLMSVGFSVDYTAHVSYHYNHETSSK